MPGPQRKRKKKYNARFPPARIKKMMQTDEDVGKVAAAVPVIISRALELFAEHLLNGATQRVAHTGAKTITPSHLKQCIVDEPRFDFLRELVSDVPDLPGNSSLELTNTEHREVANGLDDSKVLSRSNSRSNNRRIKRGGMVGRRRGSGRGQRASLVAETCSNGSNSSSNNENDSSDAALENNEDNVIEVNEDVITTKTPTTSSCSTTISSSVSTTTSTPSLTLTTPVSSLGLTLLSPPMVGASSSLSSSTVSVLPSAFSELDEDYDEE